MTEAATEDGRGTQAGDPASVRRGVALFAALNAVAMFVVSVAFHRIGDWGVETDFYWYYAPQAQSAQEGKLVIDVFRGPLYPWLLAVVQPLTGRWLHAGFLVASAASAAVLLATFVLARRVTTPRWAAAAVALVATNLVFVEHHYLVGTDLVFAALVATSAACALGALDSAKLRAAALAGALAGLSVLTRYNALLLAAAIPVVLVALGRSPARDRVRAAAASAAATAAVVAPWGLYTWVKKGAFLYNENWKNVGFELYGLDRVPWDEFWYGENKFDGEGMLDVLTRDPARVVEVIAGNLPAQLTGDAQMLGVPMAVAALVGLVVLVAGWRRAPSAVALPALLVALAAPLLVVFYNPRFSLCLLPFYAVLAAAGLAWAGRRTHTGVAAVALAAFVAWTGWHTAGQCARTIEMGPTYLLELAEAFNEQFDGEFGGYRLAARKPHLAHYVDREFYTIPVRRSVDELVDRLQEEGVGLLYFGEVETYYQPHLRGLLDPQASHPDLMPILATDTPRTVLFAVRPGEGTGE